MPTAEDWDEGEGEEEGDREDGFERVVFLPSGEKLTGGVGVVGESGHESGF